MSRVPEVDGSMVRKQGFVATYKRGYCLGSYPIVPTGMSCLMALGINGLFSPHIRKL